MLVETRADIRRVRRDVPLVGRRRIAGVALRAGALDSAEGRRLQGRMNAQLTACGCAEGGFFVLATLVVAVAVLALTAPGHGPAGTLLRGLAILPSLLVAGLAGKAFGLLLARIRFHRLCALVESRL